MADLKLHHSILMISVLLMMCACSKSGSSQQTAVFTQDPEIREIKPQKPVQIKLKRNASGSYSWELKGDNADRIIEVDSRLKGALDVSTAGPSGP